MQHVCFPWLGWQQVCVLLGSDNRRQHGETDCDVGVIIVCATGHMRKLVEHLVDLTPFLRCWRYGPTFKVCMH